MSYLVASYDKHGWLQGYSQFSPPRRGRRYHPQDVLNSSSHISVMQDFDGASDLLSQYQDTLLLTPPQKTTAVERDFAQIAVQSVPSELSALLMLTFMIQKQKKTE